MTRWLRRRTPGARVRHADRRLASLDAVLQAGLDRGLTGVALAVDQDGEFLFDGAAGLANRETQTPLAPADRFRIYSITKTFTAVLVLQLVDEGVLSLDDTVADWLDDPAVARIPNVEQITLRQLLTHTSGVYDYFAQDSPFWQDAYLGEDADWSRVWTPEELLAYADGAAHAPDFAPGEGVRYSNTGYILLGLIVEEATGQAFADRLHQQILDPLGLDRHLLRRHGAGSRRDRAGLPPVRRRVGERERDASLGAVDGRGHGVDHA